MKRDIITSSYLISIYIIIIVCFDGIYYLNINSSHSAGALNYIRILMVFSLILLIAFQQKKIIAVKKSDVFLLALISFVIILINTSSENITSQSAIAESINIFIFFAGTFLFVQVAQKNPKFYEAICCKTFYIFLFINLLLFFITSETERFSGAQLTASIFSLTLTLLLLSVYIFLKKLYALIFICISMMLIYCSGTRVSLVILLFFLMAITTYKAKIIKYIILTTIILILIYFSDSIQIVSNHVDARILSIDDLNYGSAKTRLNWYLNIIEVLKQNNYIGGFGERQHRIYTNGYILHFDLLRYWFDYSIFLVLALLLAFYLSIKNLKPTNILYLFIGFILLGFHNFIQSPELILLLSILIGSFVLIEQKQGKR